MSKMPKYHPVNQHYVERGPKATARDESVEIVRTRSIPLAAGYASPPQPVQYLSYEELIEGFATCPKHYRIFLDTCFVTAHEIPREFWDSVLSKEICITYGIWQELQPWMESPNHNRWFRDYLAEAWQSEQTGIGHPRVHFVRSRDLPDGLFDVIRYYIRLLWLRKFWIIQRVEDFATKHGRQPDAAEVQAIGQKYGGARGWKLAQKTLADPEQVRKYPADEELVVSAIFNSLIYGRPSYVLTRDNDVIEQWWKAQYLIDTHYCAMVIAEKYKADPSMFKPHPLPPVEGGLFFGDGNVILEPLKPYDPFLDRSKSPPVQCSCYLFSRDASPLSLSFRQFAVCSEMRDILAMKARTRGRNTDLFGEMNFHMKVDPRNSMYKVSAPGLINDLAISYAPEEFPIAVNDCEFAIFTDEGFIVEEYALDDALPIECSTRVAIRKSHVTGGSM